MRLAINVILAGLLISSLFTSHLVLAEEVPIYYNFNSINVHQLTKKITMRFVTSSKFTVIQWNLKAGAKLFPPHKHPNEQVTRILKGDVTVQSGDNIYHLHAGDVMIFPSNVPHGFIAVSDAIIYEQQTPIREDFLQSGFIKKLSELLKQNQ